MNFFPVWTFLFIFWYVPHRTLFLRRNSKRVDPRLHLTLLGKTSYVCCAAFDDARWTMNESTMTENPTPLSGKPWQG